MISGYKEKSVLHFEREGKRIEFDLKDLQFYRRLKSGERRPVEKAQNFFRKLQVRDVVTGFKDAPYAELIRKIDDSNWKRNKTNFATIFEDVKKHAHLESHLVLGIQFERANVFTKPVSIYSKPVLQFMIESRIVFDSCSWEQCYAKHSELITNLCNHIRQNYFLDLEVYRMFYELVTTNHIWKKFLLLIAPREVTERDFNAYYYGRRPERGYACEYKTLFDYLVKIDRTEAVGFIEAVTVFDDYLRMARAMERAKAINKIKIEHPNEFTDDEIEILIEDGNYHKVERYPKNLKLRHDIVARNYRAFKEEYDAKEFQTKVNKDLAYSYGDYKMIVPSLPEDVKAEGTNLHHCVASYIEKILDGTTQIVFMREDKNESLVTVEIRAGSIIQARGAGNRSVSDKEHEWLEQYARNKNLNYGKVKRDEKRAEKEKAVKEAEEAIKIADNAEAITQEIMEAVA